MNKYFAAFCAGLMAVLASVESAKAVPSDPTVNEVRAARTELEELKKLDAQTQERIRALEERLDRIEDLPRVPIAGETGVPSDLEPAPAGLEPIPAAAVKSGQPIPSEVVSSELEPVPTGENLPRDLWSARLGSGTSLRLMNIALFFTGTGGWSTQYGDTLQQLEGGHHDPNVRGFTLQALEFFLGGAVDPYLNFQTTLDFSVNTDGETHFDIEEGFATTQQLPLGIEKYGLQLQAGWFLAHFGRWNQQHVHGWYWVDQPIITTRFFGPSSLRQAGVNASWLVAFLPWYSNLDLAIQNSVGSTMYSFGADRSIGAIPEGDHPMGSGQEGHGHLEMGLPGGRPFVSNEVRSLSDMAYEMRWANAFDIGDAWSTEIGASAALGPNPTSNRSRTWIAGMDWIIKWRPTPSERGWPYLLLQTEAMWRNYEAAAYECAEGGYTCNEGGLAGFLPHQTLKDFGMYAQVLWGFTRGWSTGLRGGYAKGRGGPSFVLHEEGGNEVLEPISAREDPYRSERWRLSPILIFEPTHFSKIALQYNYDHTTFLSENNNHTVWLQLQLMIGSDPAHRY